MARIKRRRCIYCGNPALICRGHGVVVLRAWCRRCLDRIRDTGHVDSKEYVTYRDVVRTGRVLDKAGVT